jgi:hypothetical protein
MRKETHHLNPVGFFRGKGLVTDVTILSQELCASRRATFGREGSRRPSCESDSGLAALIEATDAKVKNINKSG